jgi:hypothetical protein
MMVNIYNPSYLGEGQRRITIRDTLGKRRPYLKNKPKQKGLEAWLKW